MNNKTSVTLVLIIFVIIQLILLSNNPAMADPLDSIMTAVECEVTITPPSVTILWNEVQTFCAETTCNGEIVDGVYSWNVQGGTADTTSGDCIMFTADYKDGTFNVIVEDVIYGGRAIASVTIVEWDFWSDIRLLTGDVYRSRWLPLPALITIEGICTHFSGLTRRPEYTPEESSLSVIPLRMLLNKDTQIINQIVMIMPSILTGVGFDGESERVTVTVEGLRDYFDINMLPFPLDKQKVLK